MSKSIDIFVKSFVVSPDLDKLFYSAQHTACAPDLLKHEAGKFRGRVLDPESATLLGDIKAVENQHGCKFRIWDLGRLRDRIKGMLTGVQKAPTIVLNGKVHPGLNAARNALRDLQPKVES